MVVYTFNFSNGEEEAEQPLLVPGQPGLHSEKVHPAIHKSVRINEWMNKRIKELRTGAEKMSPAGKVLAAPAVLILKACATTRPHPPFYTVHSRDPFRLLLTEPAPSYSLLFCITDLNHPSNCFFTCPPHWTTSYTKPGD